MKTERDRTGAQIEQDAQRLNKAIAKAIAGMQPPEDLTVTGWAEKHRRLSSESAAEPGPWRTERTPYLRDIMDAFTDPKVRHIVVWAASQVGKSELINNCIGYIIDQDPGSILFVQPTTIDAKDYSKLRIAPMIRDCPTLRKRVAASKSRDSGNTILQKTYPGGILTLCGSTEAHALCSKPIRYIFGDERDRWAGSAGNEGDPWELAMARQTTFYNAKAVEVSTPTIKGASNIEDAYITGTMERWKSKCPHCSAYHEIQWADIRFEYDEKTVGKSKSYQITEIFYICPGCGCISDEITMKRQPARWEADNPDAYANGCRSYKLNAFVSQWAAWENTIQKFLQAKGNSKKLQVVYNTCFGELFEDRGELEDEDSLLARREEYTAEVPDGVLYLTCGIDTQDNRFEYEVIGHGHFGETWGIEKGVVMGRPDDDVTWQKLDDVTINRKFCFSDGLGLRIARTFIDEGGHFTNEVRLKCRERFSKNVYCIKGSNQYGAPYISPPKQQKIIIDGVYLGTCWQYSLGVCSGKQIITDNIRVKIAGPKYCHFPRRDDYGAIYFNGLMSERLVYNKDKKQPWEWVKIPGHERNEVLDCRVYALAAFKSMPTNLDARDMQLKIARGQRPAPTVAPPVPQYSAEPSRQSSSLEDFYDEW